ANADNRRSAVVQVLTHPLDRGGLAPIDPARPVVGPLRVDITRDGDERVIPEPGELVAIEPSLEQDLDVGDSGHLVRQVREESRVDEQLLLAGHPPPYPPP